MIQIHHSVLPVYFFNLTNSAEQFVSQGPAQRPDVYERVITQRATGESAYYVNCFSFSSRVARASLINNEVHILDATGQLVGKVKLDVL